MKNKIDNRYESLVPPALANLEVYQAGRSIEEVALERGLKRVIKLASNENPLGPSPAAIKEMTHALWDVHRYPDMYSKKLREALAELYNLKTHNIILGNGSEGIMADICRTFVQTGDEILSSEKTFIGFFILAKGAGAKLVCAPLNQDFRIDVEAMVDKITPKTKIIYIANPNNPTGNYMTKTEFDFLMKSVPERCLVILDEAYFEFAHGQGDYPDSMDYRYDNVITLRTFSKAYGLSGIRIGYGFGHDQLISYVYKAKLPFAPSSIAQAGGYGALKDRYHLSHTLINNRERMRELTIFLESRGFRYLKSVANFVTFDAKSLEGATYLFEQLLNMGVIIRPLAANDMPQFLRVSLGTYDEMNLFYEAFEHVLPGFNQIFNKKK
jgi:histidinol-phosphate aminotransferase